MLRRKLAPVALVVALLTAASGCLSTAHRIPRAELMALAQKPPESRGDRVRVIQAWAGDEGPPRAPAVDSGAHVYVGVGVDGDVGGPIVNHVASPQAAKLQAHESKDWIILAALLAITLAATEGARYDGWVRLHPMYPIHLYGPNGEYTWVPLAQLDPQTAAWAQRAYVREGEGPWTALGRAPLDRVGFTYSVLLGAGQIPSVDGARTPGFLGHLQLGVFPAKTVGLLFDLGLGWRDDLAANTTYDARYALELQAVPFAAGPFHFGGFGQLGFATRLEDAPGGRDSSSTLFGGGAMLQIELTTRLAITARAGLTNTHGENLEEALVGLSIY